MDRYDENLVCKVWLNHVNWSCDCGWCYKLWFIFHLTSLQTVSFNKEPYSLMIWTYKKHVQEDLSFRACLSQCTPVRANRKPHSCGLWPQNWTHCLHVPECIVITKPSRTNPHHGYNMTWLTWDHSALEQQIDGLVQDCSNSIANVLELLQSCPKPSKYGARVQSHVACYSYCFTTCGCFTITIIKGCRAHNQLPKITDICVFLWGKSNSTTIKHVCNESAYFAESYDVDFDINEPLDSTEMLPLIGMEGMVSCLPLLHTRLHGSKHWLLD